MSGNFWLSFFTLYSLYVPKDWISTFSTNGNERYYRSMCISYKINSVTPGKKWKDKQVSNVWLMLMFCDWISAFFVCLFSIFFWRLCAHHTHACMSLLWSQAAVNNESACPRWPRLLSHFAAVILISRWPQASKKYFNSISVAHPLAATPNTVRKRLFNFKRWVTHIATVEKTNQFGFPCKQVSQTFPLIERGAPNLHSWNKQSSLPVQTLFTPG